RGGHGYGARSEAPDGRGLLRRAARGRELAELIRPGGVAPRVSDPPPVKRAILSGLTGLFHGDQTADGMPEPADDAMMDPPAGPVQDPERAIRLAALEVLAARPDAVGASVVRQALRDPSDEVRAAAVRLAAARPSRDLPDVFSLIGERQWPTTQLAALQALPH